MSFVADIPDAIRNIVELFYAGNREFALSLCADGVRAQGSLLEHYELIQQILSDPPSSIQSVYDKLLHYLNHDPLDADLIGELKLDDILPAIHDVEADDDLLLDIVVSEDEAFSWPSSDPPALAGQPDVHPTYDSSLITPPKPMTSLIASPIRRGEKPTLTVDSALITPPKAMAPVVARAVVSANPNESSPQVLARPVSLSTATLISRYQALLLLGRGELSALETEELRGLEQRLEVEARPYLEPLERVLRISASVQEMKRIEGLDSHDGFVLSLVDGFTSMDDIISLSGMPEEAALFIIFKLELMGLVQIDG
ncbi:MAG: hypothetical protein WC966_09165 [Bradymonadales bacterium]